MNTKNSNVKFTKHYLTKKESKVIGFDKHIAFRIRKEDYKKIEKIVSNNQDLFYNESHFIRCGVLKFLRDFDSKGKKVLK